MKKIIPDYNSYLESHKNNNYSHSDLIKCIRDGHNKKDITDKDIIEIQNKIDNSKLRKEQKDSLLGLLNILNHKVYEGKGDNLNAVKVFFDDEEYNYTTSVSTKTTEKDAEKYFVGHYFNLGGKDDNMQKCIKIEFIDNNIDESKLSSIVEASVKEIIDLESLKNMTEDEMIELYDKFGFNLSFYQKDGKDVILVKKENPNSTKNPIKFYLHAYTRNKIESAVTFIKNRIDNNNYKLGEKEKAKKLGNPYKVGDILYSSWGYEQTNVEFYQVIEVKGQTITLRELAQRHESSGGSAMSARVFPRVDEFIGEPFTKRIGNRSYNGYPTIRMTSYNQLSIYDMTTNKGLYSSWYN